VFPAILKVTPIYVSPLGKSGVKSPSLSLASVKL